MKHSRWSAIFTLAWTISGATLAIDVSSQPSRFFAKFRRTSVSEPDKHTHTHSTLSHTVLPSPSNYKLLQQEAFEKCWAHSRLRAASRPLTRCRYRYCRAPPAHRCPRRQRQRVTEGTAMAPWNGPVQINVCLLSSPMNRKPLSISSNPNVCHTFDDHSTGSQQTGSIFCHVAGVKSCQSAGGSTMNNEQKTGFLCSVSHR